MILFGCTRVLLCEPAAISSDAYCFVGCLISFTPETILSRDYFVIEQGAG